jgi:tetratricopeptide (TPR) repeat protein
VWAYQQGRAAWLQGDEARAVSAWQSDANIGQALLLQAQHASNIDEARRWYEAAIRSSTSPAIQAEAIVVYVEFLRRHLASTDLVARLQNLVSQVGKDTPAGWRLHAQALYERGWQPAAAYTAFSQAIALGFTDSETIHLLGSAAEKLDNLTQAENLYRQALVAVPQIESRRPWHLYRLAMILLKSDRAREAIPLLEEAATSPAGYYLYADQLALTYRAVGDPERSSAACQLAISLAHSNQPVSCQP